MSIRHSWYCIDRLFHRRGSKKSCGTPYMWVPKSCFSYRFGDTWLCCTLSVRAPTFWARIPSNVFMYITFQYFSLQRLELVHQWAYPPGLYAPPVLDNKFRPEGTGIFPLVKTWTPTFPSNNANFRETTTRLPTNWAEQGRWNSDPPRSRLQKRHWLRWRTG